MSTLSFVICRSDRPAMPRRRDTTCGDEGPRTAVDIVGRQGDDVIELDWDRAVELAGLLLVAAAEVDGPASDADRAADLSEARAVTAAAFGLDATCRAVARCDTRRRGASAGLTQRVDEFLADVVGSARSDRDRASALLNKINGGRP
ncbi:MAG: hypothetical protein AAGI53_01580 [Planctomycetota bacterium]